MHTQSDPNQRTVIWILGASFILAVGGLIYTSVKGLPIDVSLVGIANLVGGGLIGYLTRPATPPPPPPPGTVTDTKVQTPPIKEEEPKT